MDSFYASCELSKRPDIREKPFVVGADPKEGKGRGVVIACNYAARKFGIRSATPISRAWELCPDAVYVRPNFRLYEEVSRRVFGMMKQFSDRVEQVSIDEAYLDVTARIIISPSQDEGEVEHGIRALAASIKKAVWETESITCSIGAADSKIIAKMAADVNKPDGLTIVHPRNVIAFLSPLPVSKIPGVGRVTQGILETKLNVKTIEELRKIPPEDLTTHFGRSGSWLLNVANGIGSNEVIEQWEPVSQSGETTFEDDEDDYEKIKATMFEVAEEVHRRIVSENYRFRNVGIKIRFTGFETHTRSRSLKSLTDSLDILKFECDRLLSEFVSSGKKVRLIGVRVSSLEKGESEAQTSLLQWEDIMNPKER